MSTESNGALILRERRGAVAILTLNRPRALNALSAGLLDALDAALDDLEGDDGLRAVVITGAGKAFVAGADISEMAAYDPILAEAFASRGQRLLNRLTAFPVPVIAAVNGFALGGGCELAMACDIVLAGEHARFGQPEVKLGVIPGFGGTQRLVRRVGLTKALDLCLTARMVGADEAVEMGLAARKIEGDVVGGALAVAEEIEANGPVAVRLAKRAIHENADGDLEAGLA
ncbi:MAG: enoyl-CoA hydratase/isomerase family protein, partial [Deltaproteobacteria bacterium]|nr:enoyl-CoA hydratase/isomerase family protein [Deltaproteobacteria bacterium]